MEVMFFGGIAIMAFGAVALVVGLILFGISGKKLNKKMNDIYGEW